MTVSMMLPLLLLLGAAKDVTTVDQPPIEIYDINAVQPNTVVRTIDPSKSQDVKSLATYLYLTGFATVEDAEAFIQKMSFTTSSKTLRHRFSMGISGPDEPNIRNVMRISVHVKGVANKDGTYDVVIKRVHASCMVNSRIVETTSKRWWIIEWGREVAISWRPLTGAELDSIYDKIDSKAAPLIAKISK